MGRTYLAFLPRLFRPFLRVEVDGEVCRFHVRGLREPLLVLERRPPRSTPERQVFRVTGGLLSRGGGARHGRLEFRQVSGARAVLAAIHDFRPTLPWFLSNLGQARVHLWVMRRFGEFLATVGEVASSRPEQLPAR